MITKHFFARDLRNTDILKEVPRKPGYYKWWAMKEDLTDLFEQLSVDGSEALPRIETKEFNGVTYYCIYVGIEKSLYQRMNWHVNQLNSKENVRNGTLSTLRLSITSIFGKDAIDNDATNAFIDKLIVEVFECETYEDAREKELECLHSDYLYVLNIKDNSHPLAPKQKLKELRRNTKQSV